MRTRVYFRRRPYFRRPLFVRPFFRRRARFLFPAFGFILLLILLLWVLRPLRAQSAAPTPTLHDVAYATQSAAQTLDLYLPENAEPPYRLLIWVHGGGWSQGDNDLPPTHPALRALTVGYAVASLNYRLSGEAPFPAQIYDVKAAVRWLRAHASEYNLDPDRFAAMGSSAGGHLVALLGTSGGAAELEDLSMGNAESSSRVQAVIDWYGPANLTTLEESANEVGCPVPPNFQTSTTMPVAQFLGGALVDHADLAAAASPILYITPDDPPFLIQHGIYDCTVPYPQSVAFYDALLPVLGRQNVQLYLMPEEHGGSSFQTPLNAELIRDFLDRALA